MTISEKREALLRQFSGIRNSQERFAHLIALARQHPSLDPQYKTDENRVEGCLAKLWFVAEFNNGRCFFRTDSDSTIVKSIAAVLCDFYSDQTPAEILSNDPAFLEQVGISQHLTQNRRNSLTRIWEKIRSFATKHAGSSEFPAN